MTRMLMIAIFSLMSHLLYGADHSAVTGLAGLYKGNVEGVFLGLGNIAKTGVLKLRIIDDYIKISCASAFKKELEQIFFINEIEDFFSHPVATVKLKNGTLEKRVAFTRNVDSGFGFFEDALSQESKKVWVYQFKIHQQSLVACRVQHYTTGKNGVLLYFLELKNLERDAMYQASDEEIDHDQNTRKFDWDF